MTQQFEFLPLEQTMPLLNPVYPPQYYQAFKQLKKHIQFKTFDKRANQLAQKLIPFGESNYNCWYVKKMCFLAGVVTFEHEMQFNGQTLYQKVKNFQLWQHRRFLLQHQKTYEQQYQLIDKILKLQPKNYHAWSHRIWIVDQVKNYQQQLQFTRRMLIQDSYNNSVWSYRYHVLNNLLIQQQQQIEKKLLAQFCESLNNQAAWNYVRGYFPSIKLKGIPCTNKLKLTLGEGYDNFPKIIQFVKIQILKLQKLCQSPDFKPKRYHIQAQIQLLITLVCIQSQNQNSLQYAKNTCLLLAQKDKQKRLYWKWVAQNI